MTRLAGFFFFSLFYSVFACAHHGTSTFDGETVITIEGVVTQYNWTNPHGSIELESSADGINTRYFRLEIDGPSLLSPLGVSRNSLQVGDRVIAFVSPSNISRSANSVEQVLGREIIKEDGTVLGLSVRYARDLESRRMPAAMSVIGTWVPERTALFEFVGQRVSWVLTEAGENSLANYDISAPFAHSQCIPSTAPTVMVYPTAKVLEANFERININMDWLGGERVVYMDGRQHPPLDERFLQGHSIGHWEGRVEGQVLVIDTQNFSDNDIGNAFGVASGSQKHLLERLTLALDGRSLSYQYVLEDTEYLLETAEGSFIWQHRPDVSASSVECDLEAAGEYLQEYLQE